MPEFFTTLTIDAADVSRLWGSLGEARALFLAADRRMPGMGKRQAEQTALIMRELQRDFTSIQTEIARMATENVRRKIELTAKRPDGGQVSGNMADHVVSEPIPSIPSIAAVGIGRIDEMDKTVNPNRSSQTPYWRAQEYGSRAAVGRELHGLFFDAGFGAGSSANPQEFRVHPLFRAAGAGPPMTVRRPIEARHFLRDGAAEAEAAWRLRIRAAETKMATRAAAVAAIGFAGIDLKREAQRRGRTLRRSLPRGGRGISLPPV